MHSIRKEKETRIARNILFTESTLEMLRKMSDGNMSHTIRRLIEQAWVHAQEQTQGQQQEK